jgi:hypothetical protein
LPADQGFAPAKEEYADRLFHFDDQPTDLRESEDSLRQAAAEGSMRAEMRLGLGLFSGSFGRFDFTQARDHFNQLVKSNNFALILRDSLSQSECELVLADDMRLYGNIFSVLRSFFDEGIGLIRWLNSDLIFQKVKKR